MLKEKRGGRGGWGEDAWFAKYKSIKFCCSQRTKIHHKFKASKWNSKSKQLYLQGLEAQVKPHKLKCKPQGFYEAYKFHRSPNAMDLDYLYNYLPSNCCCNDSILCDLRGDKVYGVFSGNPIVVHREWEKLNNHQVCVFFHKATVDLVLLVKHYRAVWGGQLQATNRLYSVAWKNVKTHAQHKRRMLRHQPKCYHPLYINMHCM